MTDFIYIVGFTIACLLPVGLLATRFKQVGRHYLLLIFVVWLGLLIAVDDILWDAESESRPIGLIGRFLSEGLFN